MEERGEQDDDAHRPRRRGARRLLFQIVFHAELGDEEGNFNLAIDR